MHAITVASHGHTLPKPSLWSRIAAFFRRIFVRPEGMKGADDFADAFGRALQAGAKDMAETTTPDDEEE